jgi:hypothetical protein
MASTFTDLGIEKMATGENAGTWGDKTNTNLEIVEKAIAGYVEKSIAGGAQTTTLTIQDGDSTESTSIARHAVIKLTGSITGNQVVTVPDSIEKVYIVVNGTSGAYTVQFKTVSGTGITFGTSDKGTRLVFSDGTNIVDTATGGVGSYDLNGDSLILDEDQDTTITADTDDQIDIAIAGADDFRFTANTFTALSGSSVVIPDSGLTLGSTAVTSTAAELNLLDGVSGLVQADFTKLAAVDSTAAELNIVDGGTSATSTTVADADRVVLNDNGTMVQVAVTDLAAYFDDEITAMPNLVTTAATTVGALNSGSITSGFGTIDTGSSTITTTGLISGGSLDIDDVLINGSTIGHTDDTDLITLANGVATVAGEISVTTLDIGGTNVTSTAAELNIVDGGTSATSTTVADADRVVLNDNGTMVQVAVTDLAAYFDDEITAMPNLTSVGTLTTLTVDNVIVNGTTIGHTDDTDLITLADGIATVAGEISVTTLDIGGTNVTATAAEINLIDGDTARGTTAVADGDGLLVNDAGTMRMTNVTTLKTYFQSGVGVAADDISAGDAAINFTTSSGNITIDAAANNSDIIFKGTDDSSDITMLTLDGSDAGSATFNHDVILGNDSFVQFGDSGEKISGDGTDLTIASSAKLNLTATSDVHIPNNVGIIFGGDSEKIEGDGTDLVISANNLTVDAAADIILDAAGNDFQFKSGGTHIFSIVNSSSDIILKPIVDAKDLIFQQRDGTEVARIEDNGTFNVVTDKLAINGTAVTSTAAELNKLDGAGTIKQAGKETIWVPAVAMYPNTTNGCAALAQTELSNGPELKSLDFDKDADEKAQFAVSFPKSWNEGTVTFQAFFTADTTNTGTTSWSLSGVAIADDDSVNTAFGTGVAPTAKAMSGTANDLAVTAESGAVTIAGSPSTAEQVFFEIVRDVSADSLTADAKLLGVKLFFTTDAANDA